MASLVTMSRAVNLCSRQNPINEVKLGFVVALSLFCSFGWAQTLRGLEWEDGVYNTLPLKPSYFKASEPLPGAVSLKNYCPRVVSQSASNTGVAWATVWYARTIIDAIAAGDNTGLDITASAYSPVFNYKKVNTGSGCAAPIKLSSLLASLQDDGSVFFTDFMEFCVDNVPSDLKAKEHKLPGYVRLFNTDDPGVKKVTAIKQALFENNPVVAGIICPPSFTMAAEFWQPREKSNPDQGGHAVCVIGYDDQRYGGAFQVVNSWGKTWGDQGYTWIRYEDVTDFVRYGYELVNTATSKGGPLKSSIDFVLKDGSAMDAKLLKEGRYKLTRSYPTGSEFTVKVKTNQKGFLYVFGFDQEWNSFQFYPQESGIYPWLENKNTAVSIPVSSSQPYILLTPPAGKNYFCVIVSGRYLEPGELMAALKLGKGSVPKEYAVTKSLWSSDKIEFETEFTRNTFGLVVVEVDQN
jgi:Papain family cysteine protease/Domain of unknown function (DUF4384)